MGDRCTGHCCEQFWLPDDYESFKRKVKTGNVEDGPQILDMLIPLNLQVYPACDGSVDHGLAGQPIQGGAFYTCKHLTPDKQCGIYDRRPGMCAAYPYSQRCNYLNCTWSLKKGNLPVAIGGTQ
jgi:Fe-S-cluster containining protein